MICDLRCDVIGIDIVDIKRFIKIFDSHSDKFLNRVFSKNELEYISQKNIESIAGMFALKEAVSKAYGTGIGQISFKDISISHDELGKPKARLFDNMYNVSVSHDGNYAIAIAVKAVDSDIIREIPKFMYSLKKREPDTHKGTFGKIAIIGGSKGMLGSISLASKAALRSGSGLVYAVVYDEMVDLMSIKCEEVVVKGMSEIRYDSSFLSDLDALVIGPGLGITDAALDVLNLALKFEGPLLIDADALNLLNNVFKIRKFPTIITPHPGELARLLGVSITDIQNNREKFSRTAAEKFNATCVLKGYNTIVISNNYKYINITGNPGMATAGSGDVLSGIIGAFLGMGLDIEMSTTLGVYLHGLAGDIAAREIGEYSLIASDIINKLPMAINTVIE